MTIRIKEGVWQFNCCWYSTKEGEKYEVHSIDEKLSCYIIKINNMNHLVAKHHADVVGCYAKKKKLNCP